MSERNPAAEASFVPDRYEDGFRVLQGLREYVTYRDDASIRIWYSNIPWKYESHYHSAVEVCLTLEGVVDYTVEGTVYHVRKGEILIIPPDVSHGLNMEEGSSRYLYLYEPDTVLGMRDIKPLSRQFSQVFYLHDGSEAHTRIRELYRKIQDVYQQGDMMWNTACFGYLLQIYALMGQHYFPAVHPRREKRSVESEVIAAAMGYINSRYQEEITLDDVADFAGFSRYYFSRSFKKQTGYSFKEYLIQKRLQVAMDLLIRTSRPMRDIAIESGFGSIATFNRVFREKKGCTPTQYRAIYGIY
ncbi:MAG: helix-turn-helix transcriptional regulator [Clostridia bacterium]|nr:helix-turn-helix transcriptional regulator [Clostridia bacterium]